MSRQPVPGQDDGTWGAILNDYLSQSLNPDGSLKGSSVAAAGAEVTSRKGQPNGYAALNGNGLVPSSQLGTGSAGSVTFLSGSGSWAIPAGGSSVSNATTSAPGLVQLAGDLSGTATAPTVPGLAGKYTKPSGGIPAADLDTAVNGYLANAQNAVQTSRLGAANGVATLDGSGHLPAGQAPSTTVTASATDPSGRTGVLSAGGGLEPALRQFVFVEDFGAVGDAGRVTDGSMTSGSSTLITAAPLQADHRIEVVGAGSVDNLIGYVGTVGSGSASLVTTAGGSTPLTASNTVNNAVVTYGTLDSPAVQRANDAVASQGGGTVYFTPFKSYLLNQVVPSSNVTFSGGMNGKATIYVDPGTNNGGQPAFQLSPYSGQGNFLANTTSGSRVLTSVSSFQQIYKGLVISNGTGIPSAATVTDFNPGAQTVTLDQAATATNSGVNIWPLVTNIAFENLRFPGHHSERTNQMPILVRQAVGLRIWRCEVTNNASCGFYVADTTRAHIIENYLYNICSPQGFNVIDTGSQTHGSTTPFTDFLIQGNTVIAAQTEAIAVVTSNNDTSTAPYYGRIIGNHVDNSNANGVGIYLEDGGATGSPSPKQCVVIANNTVISTTIAIFVANDSTTPSPNPLVYAHIVISGNNATGPRGISAQGSYIAVTGNVVESNNIGIALSAPAGISCYGLLCANNQVHMQQNFTSPGAGITLGSIQYSSINNNNIFCEPGSTSGTGVGIKLAACGWIDIKGNQINNAPTHGIYATNSSDLTVIGNTIHNPSEIGAGSVGINLTNQTGTSTFIATNKIIDDRSTPLMVNAIVPGGASANLTVIDNVMQGQTGSPLSTLTGTTWVKGNQVSSAGWPGTISSISGTTGAFTVTNSDPFPEQISVAGGTVSQIAFKRSGDSSFTNLGSIAGSFTLMPGDQLQVTSSVVPNLFKVPLW